jgi:hypothetical protein
VRPDERVPEERDEDQRQPENGVLEIGDRATALGWVT